MDCMHPHCPMGHGAANWNAVVLSEQAHIRARDQVALVNALNQCGPLQGGRPNLPAALTRTAGFKRILALCPCLYAQLNIKITAKGVVHLCELTLGAIIVSGNVYDAFRIQHPGIRPPNYRYPPVQSGASGGDIMESLCSEVLQNHGIPHMHVDAQGWPEWQTNSHVSLNVGKMRALKLYGDILIPAAPHNLLISVKSEAARERFVVSGNRLESVGFGFFSDPREFWTTSRMNLLKRWGFSAVYMPTSTLGAINQHLRHSGTLNHAINVNGAPLYRDLSCFGGDMARVAGKLSMDV